MKMASQSYGPYDHAADNWYDTCKCCPYGYHIDLDFVRYCESVKELDRTGSINRRRDRRRQRQSREVLLGITPHVMAVLEQAYKPVCSKQELPTKQSTHPKQFLPVIPDGFDDAVTDFERTLQRSKNKLAHNLPDVTAFTEPIKRIPSNSSMSSISASSLNNVLPEATTNNNRDFDTVSIESCGLSSQTLQNIREQMVISLERTKLLEEQVKLIPQLKEQLGKLKQQNQYLHLELKNERDNNNLNNINANFINQYHSPNRIKSQSFTNIDNLDGGGSLATKSIPRKDVGVNCNVLTRNIGVGHQMPNTKSVSTTTSQQQQCDSFTDKWYNEKVKFLYENQSRPTQCTKTTQTLAKEKREVTSQTIDNTSKKYDCSTQTLIANNEKLLKSVAITAKPTTVSASVQNSAETSSVACSDDRIDQVQCEKCSIPKCDVGVGADNFQDAPTTISLANLMGPRSKSFNLGDDRINIAMKNRTVASQCDYFVGVSKSSQYESSAVNRGCQYDIKNQSKACQKDVKLIHKNTQSDSIEKEKKSLSKTTDTKDLLPTNKSVACEAKEDDVHKIDVGCNTTQQLIDNKNSICGKCALNKDEMKISTGSNKDGGSPTPSRIPRLQAPTTPVEARKFRRQDTYTKIYSSSFDKTPSPLSSPPVGLSGLDLTNNKSISNEPSSPLEKVKLNYKLSQITSSSSATSSSAQNGAQKVQIQETQLPAPESTSFSAFVPHLNIRKKAIPSKEMLGAMKVLNDSLQKNQNKPIKNASAINIIQQEWFKISSLVTANPLDVEDYLDAFEEFSSILLQFIVNMTDDSGNTAMHYAVSHGNFDVVSILLDSKVCDINKPNKAGYTSVMLVSLAEVKSQTHANVVKRLFQLADVNIRAKQHGQTALMLAVSHGRLDMVKMLLEAGADINIQDEDGSTALMCAAEHGHTEIVKHFLSQPDCDSMITDIDGSTALKIAMEAGHRHIGVLLYAHERNHQTKKKSKPASPKTPSSPLPIRSSHRALTDTNKK